ncbi:MAG: hypothetical protein HYS22_05435 [Deltaproteobacteria bacterium]|nr:hypothetical protein [Deltaproteobacteria bacterium]
MEKAISSPQAGKVALVSATLLLLGGITFSLTEGCGGSVVRGADRTITGTLASSSLATSPLPIKSQVVACSNLSIVCISYNGGEITGTVDDLCTFAMTLTIDTVFFCSLVTKDSAAYLGLFGCEESGGVAGGLPIFQSPDGDTDGIDADTVSLTSGKIVANNICKDTDQDGDGQSDFDDTDDDGDNIADDKDTFDQTGCTAADSYDSNANGVPDIFETIWGTLPDQDNDNIPNFCDNDLDGDGETNDKDTDDDNDGTPDDTDTDANADGLDDNLDADDDGMADSEEQQQTCELAKCANDFQCQLYADDTLGDDDPTNDIGTDNIKCSSGCCMKM